jgi:NADPH:quinone reductase-like Zn-dependent oxidoreductase
MASPTTLPDTIRVVHQPEKTSKRLILESGPLPSLSHPADVLIKVAATCPCLGELDWAAQFPQFFPADREPVPGQDAAGTVVKVNSSDSSFKPGDEVFCRITAFKAGGCRDYAVVRAEELALKPEGLSWAEAAATPLSALTAWQALFYQGTLKKEAVTDNDESAKKANANIKVFIAGAGTSVGTWAVQFAAQAGAGAVIALCSGAKADVMKEFGATEIVDYTKTTAADWARSSGQEADLVLDCVGGESRAHLWDVLQDQGTFLSVCQDPMEVKPEGLKKTAQKACFFVMDSIGWQLAEIAKLVEVGKMRPVIDSVYPFDKFAEAFDRVEGRRAKGKVVIQVSEWA